MANDGIKILHSVDLSVADRVQERLALRLTFFNIFTGTRIRLEDLDSGDSTPSVCGWDKTLGDDVPKCLGETRPNYPLLIFRIKSDDAVDSFRSVDRM